MQERPAAAQGMLCLRRAEVWLRTKQSLRG
jgi:hypothetical protein